MEELPPDNRLLDLVIVGAGPAGIALGAEAVAAGIPPSRLLILERGEAHSFSIRKFYPESKVVTANYKGQAAVCTGVLCLTDASKGETLTYLDRAIEDNGLVARYGEPVGAIRPRDGFFLVETPSRTYRSKTCAVAIGIDFDGAVPVLGDGYETSIPGLFLVGDLTAGKTGGSIISAFNSASDAMRALCEGHLDCPIPPRPRS